MMFVPAGANAQQYDTAQSMYLQPAPAVRTAAKVGAPMDLRSTPQIVAEAARYIGSRNPTGFRGPWCKAFVNMIARKTGHYVHASLRARDTYAMGARLAGPTPGAFRVTRGHVSIVARVQGHRVVAISGNNGRGRVGWSHYSAGGAAYYAPI